MKTKLAEYRKKAGLTQRELAEITKLRPQYLSDIEHGLRNFSGISVRNAIKIADALNIENLRLLIDED